MKKVLLCDAAFSAMPLLKALKAMQFHVGVVGGRKDDPCHALADESFVTDYSNEGTLLTLVSEHGFDYIVPGCTDVSYLASAAVARLLHLPGFDSPESTEVIHHKGRFRDYARGKGYPIPKATDALEAARLLRFPLLVKPVDSFSGKGIQKIVRTEDLAPGYRNATFYSPSKRVIFEEFVEGKLFSHSAFVKNRKITVDFFVNEYCTVYPYQVNSSSLETELSAVIKKCMRSWLENVAIDLDLCDGLVHTQFITDNRQLWLIESARRCPGDLYSRLIMMATGIDYPALYVAGFCDQAPGVESKEPALRPVSRHTVSAADAGFFINVEISVPDSAITYVPIKKSGEYLRAAPYDRAGIYFIEHASVEAMKNTTARLSECVTIEMIGSKK